MELPAADSEKWPTILKHAAAAKDGAPEAVPAPSEKYRCTGARSQKQKRLTPDEVDELVRAYGSGKTVYEIAQTFECHRTTVSGHLKARGVAMRMAPMTEAAVDQAVGLYESGMSLAKIGHALGADDETIRHRLLARGTKMRTRPPGKIH